jgi:hypothetical protein
MTCLDLNLWLCGALAVLTATNIYSFLSWCALKGELNEMYKARGAES